MFVDWDERCVGEEDDKGEGEAWGEDPEDPGRHFTPTSFTCVHLSIYVLVFVTAQSTNLCS